MVSVVMVVMNMQWDDRTAPQYNGRGSWNLCRVQKPPAVPTTIAPIIAEFVNFVEQGSVFAFGPNESRRHAARHSADICLAVAANLGLVTHAAETGGPASGSAPGQWKSQRMFCPLPGVGRPGIESAPAVLGQLAHGQRFENALLTVSGQSDLHQEFSRRPSRPAAPSFPCSTAVRGRYRDNCAEQRPRRNWVAGAQSAPLRAAAFLPFLRKQRLDLRA